MGLFPISHFALNCVQNVLKKKIKTGRKYHPRSIVHDPIHFEVENLYITVRVICGILRKSIIGVSFVSAFL